MEAPLIEGLRFRNASKDEVIIYITIQSCQDRIKFVIADISVRKYKTRSYTSINELVQGSYYYKCLETISEKKQCVANEYLKYVTEEQVAQALLSTWALCRPEI